MKCKDCDSSTVNGVFIHEKGCPEAWRDELIPCFECGFDFQREERFQTVCTGCQEGDGEEYGYGTQKNFD